MLLKTGKYSLAHDIANKIDFADAPGVLGLVLSPSGFCLHAC